ncbi:hypothetical protein WJX74_002378 [Apatococcus lobatus]|uniref:CDC20/Fizzy WD40 domain-containing protein n=1 Tax=Apatococcus lobatus TaxID=904363 RepID=A0AAW1PRE7_9CHLO
MPHTFAHPKFRDRFLPVIHQPQAYGHLEAKLGVCSYQTSLAKECLGLQASVLSYKEESGRLPLSTSRACQRSRATAAASKRILKKPLKILDAPGITDDFYSNILDWSTTDWAAVGLHQGVWLWHSKTGRVTRLYESYRDECVMSVACSNAGKKVAAGFVSGVVRLFDSNTLQETRVFQGHSYATTALAFSGNLLASGAKDSKILLRDVRCPAHFVACFTAHRSAICGLKWSHEVDPKLASGGNDNRVFIFKPGYCEPYRQLPIHRSAIKALAWSPHHHSQLVTGAGTRDKSIRLHR